ncbi:MAG: DUF4258 domain-containing protein [Mycobacteriales bacterium]
MEQHRERQLRWSYLLTDHVFDKVRSLDVALAEFETLLAAGEVIEENWLDQATLKELVLVLDWRRPLHVVIVVDDGAQEERIVTVYEPDPARWSADLRRRRR